MKHKKDKDENYKWKRLFSPEETACYLNLSIRTIYNRISKNAKNPFPFKVRRIGRLPKFDIHDLEIYVDSL